MAQTVIDSYSTELGSVPPQASGAWKQLKPNQAHGRVRMAMFSRVYTTEAAGDDTALCVIPKNARILNGYAQVSATTGSATLSFGLAGRDASGLIDSTSGATVSDNVANIKAAAAITNTTPVELAATVALGRLYETKKDLFLTVTTAAAAMAGQSLSGHILYVVD